MATKITYILEVDDKGKVKVDGLTKGFVKLDTAVRRVNDDLREQAAATSQASQATGGLISDAGLAGATLTELGRTISDSNFGIRGMANNLSQLSTLFITLVSKRGGGVQGFVLALKQLGSQLLGPLGIIIAFQTVITIIEGFTINSDKAASSVNNLNNEFAKQIRLLNTITGSFSAYAAEQLTVEERVGLLRKEFKEFDEALKSLGDNIDPNSLKVVELLQNFERLLSIRSEISITESKIEDELGKENKSTLEIERLNKRLIELMLERNDLQDEFNGMSEKAKENTKNIAKFVAMSVEEYKDLLASALKRDVSFASVFGDPFEQEKFDEFMKELEANLPNFIDDIDDYVDTQLLNEGRASLTQRLLGLEPATLEKDLQALRDKYDPILYETEEFLKLEQAIKEKYAEKERKRREEEDRAEIEAKFKHWSTLLTGVSRFLNSVAQVNEENKDIARASIIASGAAASVGVWETYFARDKSKGPGISTLMLAGSIAGQAAVIAATASALKSINTNTPLGGGTAGGRTSAGATSPTFNVVGQTQFSQLAEAISLQTGEPLRAYVVLDDVTSAEELNNKITSNSTIG